MKKNILYIVGLTLLNYTLSGCNGWLGNTEPNDFLTPEQVWNDEIMIQGVLANLYNDVPTNGNLDDGANFSLLDDFMWCGLMNQDIETARNQMTEYSYSSFRWYDYNYIYRLNDAIEQLENSTLDKSIVSGYDAEFRFLRAYAYFQMCIRMGGVPLVLKTQKYTVGMDIEKLQTPRSSEADVYNFIYDECMAIKEALAVNNNIANHNRANKYAALALASRAMLYAGSIAEYNASMPVPVKSELQEGVVGMTGEDPMSYYKKALDTAEEIIGGTTFSLQSLNNPSSDNFYKAICDKNNNTEVIWCKDYSAGKFHLFSFANIAHSMNEDNDNGSDLCPSLQLVESFKLLNGSNYGLKDVDEHGNYIVYDKREDIFANRDFRLKGTCIVPGQTFKGKVLDVQAGVAIPKSDGSYSFIEGADPASIYEGDGGSLVGNDGPLNRATFTNTGFNLRKYVDETVGTSARGQGSYIWFVFFRMGEVYLNAAEAAWKLNKTDKALDYFNKVRQRAGFGENSWSKSDLTIENVMNERRCELALEDHRLWDLKRFRKAHQLWNGVSSSSTMMYALYPYRIVGGVNNNKYIYRRMIAPRFKAPRNFRIGNYYSSFDQDALNKNPKLVQNPNV